MRLACPIAGAMLFALLAAAPLFAESIVIKNVRVHPVTAAEIPDGEVLITDGRISDVGKKVNGRGARVVDGHGLHLYPGLINAATNIGLEEIGSLRDTVDLNEIGEFNPQLLSRMSFNPTSVYVGVVRAAGITSVLTLPGTGATSFNAAGDTTVLSGQGAVMHLDGWTWEDMTVKPRAVLDMNFPEIRVPPGPSGASSHPSYADLEKHYKSKLENIDEFFEDARRYRTAKTAANPEFKIDPKLDAMIPVLEANGRSWCVLLKSGRSRMQ